MTTPYLCRRCLSSAILGSMVELLDGWRCVCAVGARDVVVERSLSSARVEVFAQLIVGPRVGGGWQAWRVLLNAREPSRLLDRRREGSLDAGGGTRC